MSFESIDHIPQRKKQNEEIASSMGKTSFYQAEYGVNKSIHGFMNSDDTFPFTHRDSVYGLRKMGT